MQPGTLRFLAPFALTALLAACGGDDGGSTDKSSDNSSATSAKHDGGLKTAVKHDAGKPKADPSDEENSDDSTDDSSDDTADEGTDDTATPHKGDAGKPGVCTANSDCHAGDAGIGCCDVPSGMCFVSRQARCPSAVTPGTMGGAYP